MKRIFLFWIVSSAALGLDAQINKPLPREDDYYKIITLPTPEDVLLEVGGVTTFPDGRIAVCTRRGDVWIVENPYMEDGDAPRFKLFASGLHEPLGLAYKDNALYAAQRGELTRLVDKNGDERADVYETIFAWPLSGYYHEYSYGPKFAPDGSMFVTGNVAFGDEEWWRGESRVPWRGWAMRITPDGKMEPWATGMRSPCGLGMIDGELFYTDNQGDWVGTGGVWHVTKGSFIANPAGLRWSSLPGSPVKLTTQQFTARIDERREKKDGHYVKPENIADEKNPNFLYEVKKEFPELRLPAVMLPHGILGISNSEIVRDENSGTFGPFAGQLFVGDQGQSKIMRVVMEKVNGEYQGVAFDFRSEFQSGVLRMSWGHDGSLFVGETNRGWGSAGSTNSGLQRLVWTGNVPLEMKTVRAMPDGFEIEFTLPVDKKTAEDLDSYSGKSFIYKYHPVYGSPPVNEMPLDIKGVKVSDDGLKVRLLLGNLRQFYIHQINVTGIHTMDGISVLHPTGYYTLNNVPDGAKLSISEVSMKRSSGTKPTSKPVASKKVVTSALTYDQIKPLLDKNTCTACHQTTKRQVGPAFADVAKRKYSNQKIVDLIYNPQPKNWPDYATEMAPMPQVSKDEALKIAAWINSLRGGD
ncbi:MAG TPA: c-type cytochrome [Cyclobacteriaceae bacterium]|nr:c-type cytochrome [Cyclobacteriaceae bacterium]